MRGSIRLLCSVAVAAACLSLATCEDAPSAKDPEAVGSVLDALHDAASKAEGTRYFSLFTPDAVFLGTDGSERWTLAEFRKAFQPYFDSGKGWTYRSHDRHVDFTPGGDVAWFDEALDNDSYGACRGSGVLRLHEGSWRIAQYNLSIPIPNLFLQNKN